MNIVHYLQALLDLSGMAGFSKALVVKCISVFLSLIYINQDRESQIQTQNDRVTKPKSQKNNTTVRKHKYKFNSQSVNHQLQFSSHKHENHKSTRHKHSFYESQILRSDHKHFIFIRF